MMKCLMILVKIHIDQTNLLSQISSNSYTPSTFQIAQILLDRTKDIYATCKKTLGKYKEAPK